MRKDLVIVPDDKPGVLATYGEILGEAGVNIEAISAFTGQGKGIVHLLVDDAEAALSAFDKAGIAVQAAREVIVVSTPDEPGHLGQVCRKLADAGINIEQAYIGTQSTTVFVVDDVAAARELLGVE